MDDIAMVSSESANLSLQIRLFGPPEVLVLGRPLSPLRTRKGFWLLALLVLRHEQDVPRSWLAGTLWPDSNEALAMANLRRSLTDLRRALGSEAARLTAPTTNLLRMDLKGAFADTALFDARIAQDGEEALQQAVALYRGPLLEGCVEEWVAQERVTREQLCLSAQETLADRAAQSGRWTEAVRCWRAVIVCDPLREAAQRGLMSALAACGDYGAVVQTYRALRVYLHQELRADPAPETTALYQRLRAQVRRPAKGETSGREEADGKRAAGSRSLGQSAASPPPAPGEYPPGNLPHPLTRLLGREQEVEDIREAVLHHRLICLTGSGGVGKTRLAIEVAELAEDMFSEGAWFVDLAPLADETLIARTVAAVVGIPEEPDRPLIITLQQALRKRCLLIVLDNCEHLREGCAVLTESLLSLCPALHILATSRQALGVTGEQIYPVSPLPLPDSTTSHPVNRSLALMLESNAAVQLFMERAVSALPGFRLTEATAPHILRICRHLDGIPLALELAAARVPMLNVEQIADRLDNRFRLLIGDRPTALPHHRTLQALFDWSFDLLSAPEQRLFRRLSVFAGGWTLEAAEQTCGGLEEGEILDLLSSLAGKSLVMTEDTKTGRRYRLLETLREYARRKMEEAKEAEQMNARHYDWFLALAEKAEPNLMGSEQGLWLDRLEADHDNLRAALRWSVEGDKRLQLASRLARFWLMRSFITEGRVWLEESLASPDTPCHPALRARALNGAGYLATVQDDYQAARRFHQEALLLRRESGDFQGVAGSLNNLGTVAEKEGNNAEAGAFFREALDMNRKSGNRPWQAINLTNLGNTTYAQCDYQGAQRHYSEALEIQRAADNRVQEAGLLNNLGMLALSQGHLQEAERLYREALTINREVGNQIWEVINLINLGDVAVRKGDLPLATGLYDEALPLAQALGNRLEEGRILNSRAELACKAGDYPQAETLCRTALLTQNALGARQEVLRSLLLFAYLAAIEGLAERAARLFGATESLRNTLGTPLHVVEQEGHLRCVRLAQEAAGDAYSTLFQEGTQLSLEQAISYALESAGLEQSENTIF